MGDNDLSEFPPHIGKFSKLEIVSSLFFSACLVLSSLAFSCSNMCGVCVCGGGCMHCVVCWCV